MTKRIGTTKRSDIVPLTSTKAKGVSRLVNNLPHKGRRMCLCEIRICPLLG